MIFCSASCLWEWLWQIDYSISCSRFIHSRDFLGGNWLKSISSGTMGSFVPGTLTSGAGAWKVWKTPLSQRSLHPSIYNTPNDTYEQKHLNMKQMIPLHWLIDPLPRLPPSSPCGVESCMWPAWQAGWSPPTRPYGSFRFQIPLPDTWTLFMSLMWPE